MLTHRRDQIKKDWEHAPYYEAAEGWLGVFWDARSAFGDAFETLDLDAVVELACGWGRHANHVVRHYSFGAMTLVDVNATSIERCRHRFGHDGRFRFVVNSGSDLGGLADAAYSAVYSYDAMVHFEYDDVFSYVAEAYRVLRPGGRALLHHSNNDRHPGNRYSQNPHWRNFMSARFFAHVALRTGFSVLSQHLMDWGEEKALDCLSLLEKPAA